MLPHVIGTAAAETRSVEIELLAEWLKSEIRTAHPNLEVEEAIVLAASKHPRDQRAFLSAVLNDPSLGITLSGYEASELLAEFEGRREASCSLPLSTIPVVVQSDFSRAVTVRTPGTLAATASDECGFQSLFVANAESYCDPAQKDPIVFNSSQSRAP